MGKFASFFLGVFLTCFLLGAGAAWFLFGKGSTTSEKAVPVLAPPTGQGVGIRPPEKPADSDGPNLRFTSEIHLAPHVAAEVAGAKRVSLRIAASRWEGRANAGQLGGISFENPVFPLKFGFPWSQGMRLDAVGKQDFGNILITAVICLDLPDDSCGLGRLPRMEGHSRKIFRLANAVRADANHAFEFGHITINKVLTRTNGQECLRSGSQIAGTVFPSSAFAKKYADSQFAMVMIPPGNALAGTVVTGKTARRPTRAELQSLISDMGVAVQSLKLRGEAGVPFSLKVHPNFAGQQYMFVASRCAPGEAELDCAAKVFPFSSEMSMSIPERGWYILVPEKFTQPTCGNKRAVFYLHEFPPPSATPIPDAYKKARPPELVEGMIF